MISEADWFKGFVERDVTVECAEGHRWRIRAAKLVSDQTWCPVCAVENTRLGMEGAREAVSKRRGWCLSKEYKNVHTPMLWLCSKGHRFWQTTNQLLRKGQWCPECKAKRRKKKEQSRTLDEVLQLTAEAGIEHTGSARALHRKTTWRCECGFEWEATGQMMLKREALCQD